MCREQPKICGIRDHPEPAGVIVRSKHSCRFDGNRIPLMGKRGFISEFDPGGVRRNPKFNLIIHSI